MKTLAASPSPDLRGGGALFRRAWNDARERHANSRRRRASRAARSTTTSPISTRCSRRSRPRSATRCMRGSLASFETIDDPAHRLACGIRFFVRRAHDEPHWGRFIVRFAVTRPTLLRLHALRPAGARPRGRSATRADTCSAAEQMPSVVGLRRLDDALGHVARARRREDMARGRCRRGGTRPSLDRRAGRRGARSWLRPICPASA